MLTPPNAVPEDKLPNNLLVADPILRDGCFDKSVVFMLEHKALGNSMGIILNHTTGKSVGDLLSSDNFKPLAKLPVFYGGPVQSDQLHFAVFHWNKKHQIQCAFNISAEQAIKEMSQSGKLVKAIAGHSAWSAGQLHDELDNRAWFTAYGKLNTLTIPHDLSLWNETLKSISPFHHIISLTPDNPFTN